jgi:hypothetical protein
MPRIPLVILLPTLALAAAGCPSAQPPAETPPPPDANAQPTPEGARGTDDGKCPTVDPNIAPPSCPQGCYWNGKECRQLRGVIVDQGTTCRVVDNSTSPPTCSQGCAWDGAECKPAPGSAQ